MVGLAGMDKVPMCYSEILSRCGVQASGEKGASCKRCRARELR